jgi:predicted acetyltransferase
MQIVELSAEHEDAFLQMIADFEKGDSNWLHYRYGQSKTNWDAARFRKYVKECAAQKFDWRPGPKKTSISRYVMSGPDGKILATGWMQFPLDETTEIDGGNLLCDVPPSLRKHGYGSVCLSLLLFEAVRAGLRRVLVTCLASDNGARRTIELNRGQFLDEVQSNHPAREGTKISRYWINFS